MTTTTETIEYGKLARVIDDLALFFANNYGIKSETASTLLWWSAVARPCGHFASAVLRNDLREAVTRADNENLRDLGNIVRFIYNQLPSPCWGSPAVCAKWEGGYLPCKDGVLIPLSVALASEEATR